VPPSDLSSDSSPVWPVEASDDGRRARLLAAKLKALVTDRWPAANIEPQPFTVGASCVASLDVDGSPVVAGWVLIDERKVDPDPFNPEPDPGPTLPPGWLGGTVVWAERHGVNKVHAIADTMSTFDARRVAALRKPFTVWRSIGRSLFEVSAGEVATGEVSPGEVSPGEVAVEHAGSVSLDPRCLAFVPMIEAAGAQAIVDHGVLRAEVLGLEVARVVIDDDPDNPEGNVRLAVGVGRHDRLAQDMMRGVDGFEAGLADAVASVLLWRDPSKPPHPANQLARSRWLRSILVDSPGFIGAHNLAPVQGLRPPKLKVADPAIAVGTDADGTPIVVACSVGVDLDAPLSAAAMAQRIDPCAKVVFVTPEADYFPAMRKIISALAIDVDVRLVTNAWATELNRTEPN
jgi:hypothetical protein